MESLSQIRIEQISRDLQRIVIRQNNFIAGEIDIAERVFYSIPRSTKNVFHLFHGDQGGLGINDEILHLNTFDIIKVKFNDRILSTTRRKWLAEGILSPFCDIKVDKQVILKLTKINMDDFERYEPKNNQQELSFEDVI